MDQVRNEREGRRLGDRRFNAGEEGNGVGGELVIKSLWFILRGPGQRREEKRALAIARVLEKVRIELFYWLRNNSFFLLCKWLELEFASYLKGLGNRLYPASPGVVRPSIGLRPSMAAVCCRYHGYVQGLQINNSCTYLYAAISLPDLLLFFSFFFWTGLKFGIGLLRFSLLSYRDQRRALSVAGVSTFRISPLEWLHLPGSVFTGPFSYLDFLKLS